MEQKIFDMLEQQGLRLTETRRALVALFLKHDRPLSAMYVRDALMKEYGQNVNKTTVYREFERLEGLGIMRGVELGDRSRYYELALSEHHHHLVCVECEKIEDVDLDEGSLEKQERKFVLEKNFRVLRHSLEFFGICQSCQQVRC